ncbi:hypothetical protein PVAP13_7KG120711 [Panicum virgatum]|uniref:Uncharacterized protein n=1 Tax=Panicum virgatum TaxID=38727 RepID=A0A8T0QEB0_PANVG|nr:hypothetical protein PVAP13_7KG120711 [Panicum virgatum]
MSACGHRQSGLVRQHDSEEIGRQRVAGARRCCEGSLQESVTGRGYIGLATMGSSTLAGSKEVGKEGRRPTGRIGDNESAARRSSAGRAVAHMEWNGAQACGAPRQ